MMRRKDREVTDFHKIIEMIDGCDVIRLGLADGDFPYIVPVNFAYRIEDKQLCFYIHGAMMGRKYELLTNHPLCSFEMDMPLQMDCMPETKTVTMRYQSVMGKAQVRFLDGEEKQHGIDVIMSRYPQTKHFDYNRDMVQHTAVMKLTVLELTAKQNPVRKDAA